MQNQEQLILALFPKVGLAWLDQTDYTRCAGHAQIRGRRHSARDGLLRLSTSPESLLRPIQALCSSDESYRMRLMKCLPLLLSALGIADEVLGG